MTMWRRSAERGDAAQQALDFIEQSAKRWNDRFTKKSGGLAEGYVEGKLGFDVGFEIGAGSSEQFRAVFYKTPVGWPEVNCKFLEGVLEGEVSRETGCCVQVDCDVRRPDR